MDAAAGSMAEFDYNLKSLKTGLSVSSGGKGGRGEGEPKKGTKKGRKRGKNLKNRLELSLGPSKKDVFQTRE